jgi:hypothetical protein
MLKSKKWQFSSLDCIKTLEPSAGAPFRISVIGNSYNSMLRCKKYKYSSKEETVRRLCSVKQITFLAGVIPQLCSTRERILLLRGKEILENI